MLHDLIQVGRDKQDGCPLFTAGHQFVPDPFGRVDVQAPGGVFQQKKGGMIRKEGQQGPLLVTAGEGLDPGFRGSDDIKGLDAGSGPGSGLNPINDKSRGLLQSAGNVRPD